MTEETQASALPDGVLSEWKPSRATFLLWTVLMVPIFLVALGIYAFIASHGELATEGSANLAQMLLVLALTIGLMCVHEGVHGIVMSAFGARPQFGVLKIGSILAGFYTTAPGHRFSRRQYLVAILAPLAVLAPLGVPACLLPFGAYLAVPFAVHLAGCIGDVTIAWHVLRAPSEAVCEDLRDGTRFWRVQA